MSGQILLESELDLCISDLERKIKHKKRLADKLYYLFFKKKNKKYLTDATLGFLLKHVKYNTNTEKLK